MALIASSLSQVCKSISNFVSTGLNEGDVTVRVTLGNPGEAPAETDHHRLNLFFFRFEPFQFDADMLPGENWHLRMHCLATPFALLEDSTSAGENDLRLVGEVLRLFHEQPVFNLTVEDQQFHVQVIPQNLGLDQINQLWSTQGDVTYRPSLLYEVSLAPVIPREKSKGAPLTGSLALETRADMTAVTATATARAPRVAARSVNTSKEDWAPAIVFVVDGECVQSLSLAVGSPELAAFTPQVWIAGVPGQAVQLRWEIWDSASGWQTDSGSPIAVVSSAFIDPEQAASATTAAAGLPFTDHAGQAVLYAVRTYPRAVDGVSVTVRSNPLLVNLYEATP
jgi:hypothetical protein